MERSERGTDAVPQADLWTVVGGLETNGIVVRESRSLESKELPDRLSAGAVVCTIEQQGNRLLYSRISGSGPARGWVSIRLNFRDLLTRLVPLGLPKQPENLAQGKDLMEACLEEAKKLIEQTPVSEPARHPQAQTPVSAALAMAVQDVAILQLARPEKRKEFQNVWAAAKGDVRKQESARRKFLLELCWGTQLRSLGYQASWEGSVKWASETVKAIGQEIVKDDHLKRQILFKWAHHPDYQQTVPFTFADIRDHVNSLRHPDSARLEAHQGGLVGHFQFSEGHFEIVPVDQKLRFVLVTAGEISRGDLHPDDIWHTCVLSNGLGIRVRHAEVPPQLLLSVEGACGWIEDTVAQALDKHELASHRVLQPEVVSSVRTLAKSWSVASAGPPDEPELRSVPHPLLRLVCDASDERQELLDESLKIVSASFSSRGQRLVYASCGVLWFDWWLIEGMLAKGYHLEGAHFIDARHTEAALRNSGMHASPLGDMACWLRACGIRSFAHESLADFARRVPSGAHVLVLVHSDADELNEACPALHADGLLFSCDARRNGSKMICL